MAVALLAMISVSLLSISSHVSRLWSAGESQNQHRIRARAALEYMGREMQLAVIPINPAETNTLQFVVNPGGVGFSNHDSVFWQAPIARDQTHGELAEVGYFVRWQSNNTADLCRFLVTPDTATNYLIYSKPYPSSWVNDAMLDLVAPAGKASHYQGVFLENAVGLWVKASRRDGSAWSGDSRLEQSLPATVEISLVLLDSKTAARLAGQPADAQKIRTRVVSASTAREFLGDASLPAYIRAGATEVAFAVNLINSR